MFPLKLSPLCGFVARKCFVLNNMVQMQQPATLASFWPLAETEKNFKYAGS